MEEEKDKEMRPARQFDDASALGLRVVDATQHCEDSAHGGCE